MSSSSDDEDRQKAQQKSGREVQLRQQKDKFKAKALKVDIKRRTTYRFKLPIQQVKTTDNLSKYKTPGSDEDFEPIIIEEVFFNSNFNEVVASQIINNVDPTIDRNQECITPQAIFDRVKMMQAVTNGSRVGSSFLSLGQSTQMAGYPKLTPNNKVQIRDKSKGDAAAGQAQSSLYLTQMKDVSASNGNRLPTDESCDFFSDNLSETAAGAIPDNKASRTVAKQVKHKQYHLFVFVHGFQASSHDMKSFRNHLQILLPNAMFLVSQANERDTDSRIEELGQKLA